MTLRPTLYTARWVLPVTTTPLRDAGVLVSAAGRIEQVARMADIEVASDVVRIDLGDAALLPGLINVHAHPELSAFRGLLEDLPFHEWIPSIMRCKRGARLTLDDYIVSAQWTCLESLRAGITTMGATEDSGAAVHALTKAHMRGVVFLEVFGPAPDQADAAMQALRGKVELHAPQAGDRVRIGISPHAPYTVSDALYARVAAYSRAESLPIATHAAEAEAEELLIREALGPFAAGLRSRGIATEVRARSTIALLKRTGILELAPLLIHAVRVSSEDLRDIAAAGATIAHCPIANARLGHGIAPIVEALEQGVRVAIGTDSVASNNRLDLLEEAHIAQALQRARLGSAAALPSAQLLQLTTIEAARILGMADEIGSLETGKAADMCAVDLATPNAVPVVDPVSAVFHAARGSDVILTMVAGEVLFERGHFRTLDAAALRPQVDNVATRLVAARAAQ